MHFQEAYELRLQSGGITGNPYHSAANAIDGDNNSIRMITELLTNIHLAHNANTQAIKDKLAALHAEIESGKAALIAT